MPTNDEVVARLNEAFLAHDGPAVTALLAPNCLIRTAGPAPAGESLTGRAACGEYWAAIAVNAQLTFDTVDAAISRDRAAVRWRCRDARRLEVLRGVNLLLLRHGQIVEVDGYVKSGGAS